MLTKNYIFGITIEFLMNLSNPDRKCYVSACREPKKRRRHATLDSGPTLIGTTRFYKCDDGFINVGDLDITCMADATWSKIKFKCVRK